jgi:serine/threonine-protein kinase
VPRALDRLVLRCLAKDPAARYPDGNALAEALARVPRRRARPWPRALLAAAPLTALALVVGLAAWRTTPRAPRLAAPAPSLLAPPSADPTPDAPALVAPASPPSSAHEEAPRIPASARPASTPPARALPSSSAPRPAIDPLAHQK